MTNVKQLVPVFCTLGLLVNTASSCQADEPEKDSSAIAVSAGQEETILRVGDETTPGQTSTVQDTEMLANLNLLLSTDDEIRRKALAEMALEFSSGAPQSEGKYSNYGDELLSVLHRVILDLNDPYADDAIEAIFWMGTANQFRVELDLPKFDDVGKRELREELEKVSHYPIPSDYGPLKEGLMNVLRNSKDDDARYWAALALADGFEPVSEIERVLVTQFPIEEANWRVQSAILGSLSEIADRNEIDRLTELTIIDALTSPNLATRKIAVTVVRTHQFDGALERLIDSLPTARDAREYGDILNSIFQFSKIDDVHIVELDKVAAKTGDEEKKKEIRSTIQQIRYAISDTTHHFGLVELRQSFILLHTAHRGLRPGAPVAVIGSDVVLIVGPRVGAEVEKVADVKISSHPVVAYYLGSRSTTLAPDLVENAVVYLSPDSPAFPKSSLQHSSCTSNEGIHHSVWSTQDAGRVRVWSAYRHLEYAVDPNCSDENLSE